MVFQHLKAKHIIFLIRKETNQQSMVSGGTFYLNTYQRQKYLVLRILQTDIFDGKSKFKGLLQNN